jgi:hypothetical protein
MGFALATTAGLIIWLVLWAIGQKPLDAFLVTIVIVLVAATLRILSRYLPGRGSGRDALRP